MISLLTEKRERFLMRMRWAYSVPTEDSLPDRVACRDEISDQASGLIKIGISKQLSPSSGTTAKVYPFTLGRSGRCGLYQREKR